ncbi:MAG: CvpA family protein [Acidiferrobacterales bacterium]|nr:CvpA family protein [Acidiferrobacterales bacterium]
MSGFDWIIAVIFLLSVLIGVMRGFIKEALSIASWILAFWLANTFCTQMGEYVGQFIEIPAAAFRTAVGFAVIFVGTLFIFAIIRYVLTKLLVKDAVKGTDRVLGIFFGVIRAVAIVVTIVLIARGFGMDSNDWWQNSNYLEYFLPTADYIEQLLPEQLQSTVDDAAEILDSDKVDAIGTLIESLPDSSSAEE